MRNAYFRDLGGARGMMGATDRPHHSPGSTTGVDGEII